MSHDKVFRLIFDELLKAEKKHPGWPIDIIHGVAIMAKEAGEAIKASIDYNFNNGSLDDLKKELAQTGAMVIRNLLHIYRLEKGGV